MFNKFKFLLYFLVAGSVIFSCSDEAVGPKGEDGAQGEQGVPGAEGAEGPQGEPGVGTMYKTGYIDGHVTGTRRDGTSFNEPFKYEYTRDQNMAFEENQYGEPGVKNLYLYRFNTDQGSLSFNLKLDEGNNLVANSSYFVVNFSFRKELDANTLFSINASPFLKDTEGYIKEISAAENSKYKFQTNSKGSLNFYLSTYYGTGNQGIAAHLFYIHIDGVSYAMYYSQANGSLLGIQQHIDNSFIEQGPLFDLYNELKFTENADLGIKVFYDVTSGNSLHEEVPFVPADEVTITNFVHDDVSGLITFDYNVNISGHVRENYRRNTTNHDLTITGSFNSGAKVYKNTTYRTSK